jgi:NADPH:quinone reductase-like Zn-dependent oxidoreductase
MRVVRLRAAGGPEQLAVEEVERPRPGPGEALVRVHAAAITRDELQWPVDRLPAIPSYELSGVVEEVGPGVAGVAAGDEVFALTSFDRDGVAADYAALPAELLVARPRAVGLPESAAIPLPALTAWQGLFDHGRLQRERARADPRRRGCRRRLRRPARPRTRRARDRDRIGGEPGIRPRTRRT